MQKTLTSLYLFSPYHQIQNITHIQEKGKMSFYYCAYQVLNIFLPIFRCNGEFKDI